jgi:hypothetical protein
MVGTRFGVTQGIVRSARQTEKSQKNQTDISPRKGHKYGHANARRAKIGTLEVIPAYLLFWKSSLIQGLERTVGEHSGTS